MYRRLGRKADHRKAMFRNLATSVIMHGSVETTEMKAKEIASIVDKLVTLGKRGDLHARRQVASYVRGDEAVKKLFDEIAPAMKDRNGGYTRVVKSGYRRGDNASMAIIQFVK